MTTTTGLVWRNIAARWHTATGKRGTYTVRHLGGGIWGLFAKGPDGLSLMDIPITGRLFWTADEAKAGAAQIDTMPPVGEMSGS